MARCTNDAVLAKIGQKKIESNQEIEFSVRRSLNACRRINTRKAIDGEKPFRANHKPVNRFECMPDGCSTTGTATIETAKYFLASDATEFSSGVVTMYVEADTFPTTVTVKLSDKEDMSDADVYEIELTENMKTDDGFIPVLVKLSDPPTSQEGDGWEASSNGVYIQVDADNEIGLSTITVLNSLKDFMTNQTVKLACISSAGGSFDIPTIENQCREAEYDDSVSQLSFPVSARLMTPNWRLLSPMYEEGKEDEGYVPYTAKKTVESFELDGVTYGRVKLADAHESECRFWGAQLADSCSPFEAQLTELTIPVITEVEEGYFQVVRNEDGVSVIFNESYIGQEVLIEYPQKAEIQEMFLGTDHLNEVKVSMAVPYTFDGGVTEIHVYDNVLVSGFPMGLSNADQDVSFTITITKVNGKFARIQRVIG